jgi:hypothetical protein
MYQAATGKLRKSPSIKGIAQMEIKIDYRGGEKAEKKREEK